MSNLFGSICLDDIPAGAIETSQKNGKRYVRISINERREVDQYGNSHNVRVNYRPDPADAQQGPFYIGDLKTSTYQAQAAQPQPAAAPAPSVQPQPQASQYAQPGTVPPQPFMQPGAQPGQPVRWDPVTGQWLNA